MKECFRKICFTFLIICIVASFIQLFKNIIDWQELNSLRIEKTKLEIELLTLQLARK